MARPKKTEKKEATKAPKKAKEAPAANGKGLDVSGLEGWLWDAACVIRGPVDAPKFKDYILPLIFLKRLSDVFDDEIKHLAEEYGKPEVAQKLVDQDHKLVRFYVPKAARWNEIAKRTTGIGEYLTDAVRAVAKANPKLSGVIDVTDFNATQAGQRILDDDRLLSLVQVLNNPDHRLGLDDVEPDILGRAYEYLLRKFAEGQGSSAGEFYTPREVGILMAKMLAPQPGMTVYDPTCGSGGLLIKAHLELVDSQGEKAGKIKKLPKTIAPLKLFGQETNHSTFAMARMNAFIHDMEADIALGNTMTRPHFLRSDGGLKQFDLITANPMWNQDFEASVYENDPYKRFVFGIPPSGSGDWGWIQHMFASLSETGRMAVVLDTGAVSRGSGNQGANKERDIRKVFVENDWIEAVVLLPENLFYNTTAPGIIITINKRKKHKGEILLVNGSKHFSKGRPKNFLELVHIANLADVFSNWKSIEGLSAAIKTEEVAKNDFNLSPTRYVANTEVNEVLSLTDAIGAYKSAKESADLTHNKLMSVLEKIGFSA